MKKIILVAALVLVSVVGLTSFNGKEAKKEKGNSSLIAQLEGNTGGTGTVTPPTTGTGTPPVGGGKKQD